MACFESCRPEMTSEPPSNCSRSTLWFPIPRISSVINQKPYPLYLFPLTFFITWTCPLKPVVPLSIKGTLAARHILFTCRRASRLSNALKTTLKVPNQSLLNWLSLIFAWYASIFAFGWNLCATSFATYRERWTSPLVSLSEHFLDSGFVNIRTRAFGFLICSTLNRNWRFKLLRSIVSRSIIWISPKPVRSRFFSSSQPIPPAPTRRTRDYEVIVQYLHLFAI